MNLLALSIFLVAFVASTYATISPEVYWKVKLPNTQIPKVIKDFLPQSELKQDNTKVYYGLSLYGTISWHRAATEDEIRHFAMKTKNMIKQVTEGSSFKGDLDRPLEQYFFLEQDLKKGKVINFPTLLNNNKAPFLPRKYAESIPFSMDKFSEILNHLSIDSESKDAQAIKKTIQLCEEPEVKHKEKRICATSLESMVDFGLSLLGSNNKKILAITSEVQGETQESQRYTIEHVQQIADGNNMVCHKLNYAYALHYCHYAGNTRTFMVSMVGANGTKIKAVSVCHKDASFWNPKALPFVVLKVKPGTTPICHFLKDDQIVFVPSE